MSVSIRAGDNELLLQLERTNWTLAAISAVHSVMIRAKSEDELYAAACEALTLESAFELAWIGVRRHDVAKSVEIRAKAGRSVRYVDGIRVSWDDSAAGRGPAGRALRLGTPQCSDCLQTTADFSPWRDRATEFGLRSSLALPIKLSSGEAFAVLVLFSRRRVAFGDSERELLGRFAEDIGYGVESVRTRSAYELALAHTQRQTQNIAGLLEDSVRALGAALEKRDPYTAGHQQRVAALSVAIAAELGLDADQTQGLRLAALVHDLGKIQVPAEILVKPGRLNELEWQLLQEHPRVAYDILRPVAYPWPVAEAVLQHHERLDGSGYPQGLRGAAISIEARIIGVADIVESVSSHRPYRAALGLERALQEIRKQTPDKLDARVVTACERVIRDNGFQFDAGVLLNS